VRCEQVKIAVVVSNLVEYLRTSDGVDGQIMNWKMELKIDARRQEKRLPFAKIKNRKG
jgi:hypothetical protein